MRKIAENQLETGFRLGQNFMIPEPQDSETRVHQISSSSLIEVALITMLTAVDFDDQTGLDACEIGDEWSDRMLPTKLVPAQLTGAQSMPEMSFGVRHPAPQRQSMPLTLRVAHAPS